MNYKLIYDVSLHSSAPLGVAVIGGGIAAIVLVSLTVMHFRAEPIGNGIKFFSAAAIFLLLLSGLLLYEKHWIANKLITEGKTVEGVVVGHWTSWERSSAGSKFYNEYEGFYVNGLHFSYTRSTDGNYFANRGSNQVKLQDGLRVKLHYLEEKSGERVFNRIARFEMAHEALNR